MADRKLRCVVLDRVYDQWSDPVVQGLFQGLVELKRAGFGTEYGYGVLPVDTHDLTSTHFAVVEESGGKMIPLMAARMTTVDRARLFNMTLPALQLCALAAAPYHGSAVQQLIDRCAAEGRRLSYWGPWTIHPEARADPGLGMFLAKCLGGIGHLLARECGVTDQILGATLRFEVDRTGRTWGFEPMLLDGAPLPPLEVAHLLGEPVLLMHQAQPSKAIVELAEEVREMWAHKLLLAPGDRISDDPPPDVKPMPRPERPQAEPRMTQEGRLLVGGNLLDMLSRDDRARLFALGRPRVVEAGEEVVRQGSMGECLFVVEEGELEVVRCLPGDEEEVLAVAQPGMLLGELAVLDGGARAASLRARRRSVLREIGLGAFEALTLYGADAGHRILRAVAASVQERLSTTRRVASEGHDGEGGTYPEGGSLEWKPADEGVIPTLRMLPAFKAIHPPEWASMLPKMRLATVVRGADLVFPEANTPGVVIVLRGALSPWLEDRSGLDASMPAVGPGGFVDYAHALHFTTAPSYWRARSPTLLLKLDRELFDPRALASARLLYALSRGLATKLRRATGLAMHFRLATFRNAWDARRTHAKDTRKAAAPVP